VTRRALVLLFVLGFASPALARFDPPSPPLVRDAHIEVGSQLTSTGLYQVTRLVVDVELDARATHVRITIGDGADASWIDTPSFSHIDLAYPDLRSHLGTVRLSVEAYAADSGDTGLPAVRHVVVQRKQPHRGDDLGFIGLFVIAPFLLALGVGLTLVLVARVRMRRRAAMPAAPFALPAAEQLARSIRLRSLAILAGLAALAGYATTIASDDVVVIGFFVSPALLVVALAALVRLIDAMRAMRLLRHDGALAEVRLDQVEIIAARQRVVLRGSRWLVDRARRHAIPRASV
jgi:hypothetical protein